CRVTHFSAEHDGVPQRTRCGIDVHYPQTVQNAAAGETSHPDLFSNLFKDRPLARRNKVGIDVTVQIRNLTHVWCFVEIKSPRFLLEESGFRYGRESIQPMTTCR